MPRPGSLLVACGCATALVSLGAQQTERVPTAQLVPAPRLVMPGAIDSNIPMTWNLVDGRPTLFAMASWGGVPALLSGPRTPTGLKVSSLRSLLGIDF